MSEEARAEARAELSTILRSLKQEPDGHAFTCIGTDGVFRHWNSDTFEVIDAVRLSTAQIKTFLDRFPFDQAKEDKYRGVDGRDVPEEHLFNPPEEIRPQRPSEEALQKHKIALEERIREQEERKRQGLQPGVCTPCKREPNAVLDHIFIAGTVRTKTKLVRSMASGTSIRQCNRVTIREKSNQTVGSESLHSSISTPMLMASPLGTTPTPHTSSSVDPHRKSHYTLNISDDLLNGDASSSPFSAVRLNHKPSQSPGTIRTTKLKANAGTSSLDIQDDESGGRSIYHYDGHRKNSKKSFALVFDPASQTFTLQPLVAEYSFNLRSTPWEKNGTKLSEQYPQLLEQSEPSSDDDGLNNLANDDMADADPNNPFDFRHHLVERPKQKESYNSKPKPTTSNTQDTDSIPRERATSNPEGKSNNARTTQRRPAPKIRMDRRASTRDEDPKPTSKRTQKSDIKGRRELEVPVVKGPSPSLSPKEPPASKLSDVEEMDDDFADDDYGTGGNNGLEIDFGDSPPRRQRAVTLPGSSHGGPISLRSAANSPSSQIHTPPKRDRYEDDFAVDLDNVEADVSEDDSPTVQHRNRHYPDDDDAEGEEGDGDVEPMLLGSPAHGHADLANEEDFDEDAEFESQFLQGLAQSEHNSPVMESESESEAE
ncbi:hypothetical protein BT63DRAFT_416886 [Microthyrium microscopicum]|uniref:Transcription elongation factor Eaf N-terminal domain-containing protein n=1 Tax=Microthyrium microscopicum TaxID=703497 RepID=A0A6A6TZ12_9PEZI|nr:hypothetical protein BT63DRAFT_416886 [Microthyrium microscopicum]